MKKTTALLFALLLALPAVAATPAETTPPAAACDLAPDAATFPLAAERTQLARACELPPPLQNDDCICAAVYDPVCGCNGETYSNACFARCEVFFWTPGECESSG
jgi:hypothetical protein